MKEIITEIQDEIFGIFDYLHQNPEISWEEFSTTAFIGEQLQQEGYRVQTFDDCTGVIGEIGDGGFTVGLRADLDALWQEVSGQWKANHSCGHDAHMTMALGVVKVLNRLGYKPPGKLKVIFQPAEEKGTGALKMLEKGVVDDVDFLYGVHLRPIQELTSGLAAPAIVHGAAQFLQGEIRGVSAHAARPHLGVNVIEVGGTLVQELSKIHTDPQAPSSVKMTKFIAGDKSGNIIPDHAEFMLDVRAQTNEVMDVLLEKIEKIAQGLSIIYGAGIQIRPGVRVAAAQVNEEAKQLLEQSIVSVLGKEKCAPPVVTSGGEDFHFYTLMKPELKATMLGLGCNLQPGLHHPLMSFDRRDLLSGIEILATTVIETFNKDKRVNKK
ncbi:M20 peptidase aminoacylase family protein [Aneurinibacillus tyrosinisolvens]|uniref:M20 peptidase aminoacylase family protein n=1 Tax=Aneurinibacillus tyrosinisolvens TaxID=1443435 RepID=UPI00063FB16F|nr:M20 peptidase aminoacylase family protein [Aneurinibacillus tyrosinisolvens]